MVKAIALISMLLICPLVNALEIRIPSAAEHDSRSAYKIELLKLILSKSPQQHSLVFAKKSYSQARIVEKLKISSADINLYWMGTSTQLENELLPIRIPLYRGLTGYRLFIINKDDQADFNNINTLAQLQALKGAQGIGWSDIEILEQAGLKQYPTSYENIFHMINHKRNVDYFSRSVMEVNTELVSHIGQLPNLKIDDHILLIYPFAMFFFTNKHNKELAEVIEGGFIRAYDDGSFLRFFNNHPEIKPILNSQTFKRRTRIIIDNPTLSEATKGIDAHYWLENNMTSPKMKP